MRFIHIADVHLGAEPDAGEAYSRQRPRELWDALEHVINICEKEQTDLLLIAGDLFHRQPLMRELKELDYLFSTLTHTQVVLIAGNHDYIRRDSYYRTFEWGENVYPIFGEVPEYVDFPELDTVVYGLSYHRREIREPLYDRFQAQGIRRHEILLAHGGDEKHIPFSTAALEKAGFDYVALGHIHKPQAVRKNRIVYAGALEPVDVNDVGPHGYVRGEITGEETRVQWVPCAKRRYIHLEVPVEEEDTLGSLRRKIREQLGEMGNDNIYKIILKGHRSEDFSIDTRDVCDSGNVVEVSDQTIPALDLEKISRENRGNLIGAYIRRFENCQPGSAEYQALCEGVETLLANRRG